jgi:hypothetical protein
MGNRTRRRALAFLAVAALAAVGAVLLLHRGGGPAGKSWLRASATLTPGVTNPDVTQRTIHTTICVTGWTKTIRPPVDYTNRLKREQMAAWQLPGTPADYQEDHLISLGIGGNPSDPRNLWPEPLPHAEEVDAVERDLRLQVCDGRITLADAQRRIANVKHESG